MGRFIGPKRPQDEKNFGRENFIKFLTALLNKIKNKILNSYRIINFNNYFISFLNKAESLNFKKNKILIQLFFIL